VNLPWIGTPGQAARLSALPDQALQDVPCHPALVGVPVPTELAASVSRRRWSVARSALSLCSERADLRFERSPQRFLVADAAEQVGFVLVRQAGAFADDVSPQATADAEGREQAEPGAPNHLEEARAEDVPEGHRLEPGQGEGQNQRVQENRDPHPDGRKPSMAAGDDRAPDVELGEPDEDGERGRAQAQQGGAGVPGATGWRSAAATTRPRRGMSARIGRSEIQRPGLFMVLLPRSIGGPATGGDLVGRPSAWEARFEGLLAEGPLSPFPCAVGGAGGRVRDRSGIPAARRSWRARRLERRARPRRSRGYAQAVLFVLLSDTTSGTAFRKSAARGCRLLVALLKRSTRKNYSGSQKPFSMRGLWGFASDFLSSGVKTPWVRRQSSFGGPSKESVKLPSAKVACFPRKRGRRAQGLLGGEKRRGDQEAASNFLPCPDEHWASLQASARSEQRPGQPRRRSVRASGLAKRRERQPGGREADR